MADRSGGHPCGRASEHLAGIERSDVKRVGVAWISEHEVQLALVKTERQLLGAHRVHENRHRLDRDRLVVLLGRALPRSQHLGVLDDRAGQGVAIPAAAIHGAEHVDPVAGKHEPAHARDLVHLEARGTQPLDAPARTWRAIAWSPAYPARAARKPNRSAAPRTVFDRDMETRSSL